MATLYEKIVESTIYREPQRAPRVRDPSKPLEVICPGLPRSATESLAVALKILGYDYTYHGWDIPFEEDHRMPAWVRLARKKWHEGENGETNLTRDDLDAVIGHSVALVEAPACCFAADLIAAYPEAKVILNMPRDLDKWHRSAIKNIAGIYDSWLVWYSCLWTAKGYWSWSVFERYLWLHLFRATDGNVSKAIHRNGKWIYREHAAMIRGLVPKENLLEWSAEDGWEPLCKFLNKPVPNEPFPNVNDASGFAHRVQQFLDDNTRRLICNHVIVLALVATGAAVITGGYGRSPFSRWWKLLRESASAIRR